MKLAATNVIPASVPSARSKFADIGFSGDVTQEAQPTATAQPVQTESTQTITTPTATATQTVTPAQSGDVATGAVLNKLA